MIPKREEPGKTVAPCVKVPGSSRVPHSFVIGPAVINTHTREEGCLRKHVTPRDVSKKHATRVATNDSFQTKNSVDVDRRANHSLVAFVAPLSVGIVAAIIVRVAPKL